MNHLIPTTSIRGYQPSSSGRIPQYENCRLCPRSCGANRYEASGFCGCGTVPKAARAALHQWEEPCLSGIHGSGTVFFSRLYASLLLLPKLPDQQRRLWKRNQRFTPF